MKYVGDTLTEQAADWKATEEARMKKDQEALRKSLLSQYDQEKAKMEERLAKERSAAGETEEQYRQKLTTAQADLKAQYDNDVISKEAVL